MLRHARLLVALAALLLAVPLGVTPTATAQQGGGCEQGSTPGLVVTGEHHAGDLQLALAVQTTKAGVAHGTLVFRAGDAGVAGLEIHRVFLKEDHEGLGGLGAGIRGRGYLADGSVVRVHVDVGDDGAEGDRVRVRWRAYHSEHEAQDAVLADQRDCDATWLYDSGWMPVKHVKVHQR